MAMGCIPNKDHLTNKTVRSDSMGGLNMEGPTVQKSFSL